jgi:Putative DNA-binding domain
MHDLFEQLAQEGEAGIKRLITQRVQENVELEFKGKSNPGNSELTKDDRRNLGITLSALSNSMGGLLIWGVVAAKNEDKIDCESEPQPICQIERFKNEIERAISQAISPKHDGIRVSLIESSETAGSGYLVIHVERSERRPHRCEFGEKQYFKRIGDSSIAMEHYDIEDSFKRIVVPSLDVEIRLSDVGRRSRGPEGETATVMASLILVSKSQVSARYPYLIVVGTTGITALAKIHRGLQLPAGRHCSYSFLLFGFDLKKSLRPSARMEYPSSDFVITKSFARNSSTSQFTFETVPRPP